MPSYLLDHDPLTSTKNVLHTDHVTGEMVIESIQDAEAVVEYNARMAPHLDKKQDWWFVGSVPLQVCQQWAQESGTRVFTRDWQEYAKKQLQMPEYRKLNVNNIRL